MRLRNLTISPKQRLWSTRLFKPILISYIFNESILSDEGICRPWKYDNFGFKCVKGYTSFRTVCNHYYYWDFRAKQNVRTQNWLRWGSLVYVWSMGISDWDFQKYNRWLAAPKYIILDGKVSLEIDLQWDGHGIHYVVHLDPRDIHSFDREHESSYRNHFINLRSTAVYVNREQV